MPDPSKKRPLTQQEKERALFLHTSGHDFKEIGRELNVDARKIAGYIQSQVNFANVAKLNPPRQDPPPSPENPMSTSMPGDPSMSAPPPHYAPPAPPPAAFAPTPPPAYNPAPYQAPSQPQQPPPDGGWAGGRQVFGHQDGFTNQSQQVRTVVEREVPADGVLGEHFGPITREQLCEIYGEGLYKALRYEPGRTVPFEHKFRASSAYGPAKTPRRTASADPAARPGFSRPWSSWRAQGQSEEEDGRSSVRPTPVYSRPDSGLSDFARHQSAVSDAATTEAIKQMGRTHEQMIEHLSKSQAKGPDTFVTDFYRQQQAIYEAKSTEEAKRRELDRQEEVRRRDQEKKDEETRWDRRQKESEESHKRELERIRAESQARLEAAKEERKSQMDLEQKRLEILREEYKNRETALRDELKRNRDEVKDIVSRSEKEIKETREAMQSQIAESDQRFQQRFQEHQEALDREQALKEKTLETQQKFQDQIFDLKREAIQQSGGDQLFQTINTVIKEFSKGLERVVDLKKIEALTPEAQAAAVANGSIDGNMMGGGDPKKAAADAQAAAARAASPSHVPQNSQQPVSQGAPPPANDARTKEQEMELIIQDMVDKPFFKQVIKEWALHVKQGENPSTFANMYMEWMRDPMDHEGRKATTMFANFMSARDWPAMMAILGPKLDKDVLAIFKTPAAIDYYDAFKTMVVEQIAEYWEQFVANRKSQRAAATAAGDAARAEAQPVEAQTEVKR